MIEAFYAKAEKYFSGEKRKNDSNPDSIDLVANEWNEECQKLSKEVQAKTLNATFYYFAMFYMLFYYRNFCRRKSFSN